MRSLKTYQRSTGAMKQRSVEKAIPSEVIEMITTMTK